MHSLIKLCNVAFMILPLISTSVAAAQPGGITVGGTRVIFNGNKKETSLSVTNSDANPYLIQSWAETQAGATDKAPFIITPPLFRMEGNQQTQLRIVRTGTLPEDRESLYWINVKSIPSGTPKEGVNTLQIAIKTRIKLIFRPQTLKGSAGDVTEQITWHKQGNKLTVKNPTPYVMNFHRVTVGGKEVKDATYVLPMSSATYTLPAAASGPISWKLINDYGGIGVQHTAR